MTANSRHLALSGRRGTPPDWVEMSRSALGGHIELDPMSEPVFNQIVRAERIYTELDGCFAHDWNAATVFLNPHGGLVVEAWRKLVYEWQCGRTRSAIWIGFSMEQLNLLADETHHPDDFSKLTVRKRIAFLDENLQVLSSPTHANYIVGMGIPAGRFRDAFAGRGRFSHGSLAVARQGVRVADDEQFGGVE